MQHCRLRTKCGVQTFHSKRRMTPWCPPRRSPHLPSIFFCQSRAIKNPIPLGADKSLAPWKISPSFACLSRGGIRAIVPPGHGTVQGTRSPRGAELPDSQKSLILMLYFPSKQQDCIPQPSFWRGGAELPHPSMASGRSCPGPAFPACPGE